MSTYDKRKSPLKNIITLLISKSQKALSSTHDAIATQVLFYLSGRLDALELGIPVTAYTANGAIALTTGLHAIEKTGSAAAMTVAAPTAAQDGVELTIIGNTDFAHVITFTGGTLLDGTTGANTTATLAAFKGSGVTVVARGSTWLLKSAVVATIAAA